jgi:hypothetical protein
MQTEPTGLADLFGNQPEPQLIDRSTLERWATCPQQAWLIEAGRAKTGNVDTASGQIVHDAIAGLTAEVYAGRVKHKGEGADMIRASVIRCRPDLQLHALDAIAYSAWEIAEYMLFQASGEPRSPEDIMAFDGGPDGARGQLAIDVESAGQIIRLTCEVDLLMATASVEMAELTDYKTGHATLTAEDVKASFQFGTFYPYLVFSNYPDLTRLRVRIFNTRCNNVSPAVEFRRDKFMGPAWARIQSALELRAKYANADNADVPTWPETSKCSQCDAIQHCADVDVDVGQIDADPVKQAQKLIVLEQRADKLKTALNAYVDKHGEIQINANDWYGRNKPTKEKKKPGTIYQLKGGE